MKEMVYKPKTEIEVLDNGEYGGRKYLILSLGIHPTAYVSVSDKEDKTIESSLREHDFTKQDSSLFNKINVHGGFSFYGNRAEVTGDRNTVYVGWDYGHCSDFSGIYQLREFSSYGIGLKHWTTSEILAEVKSVIEQLNELEVFK